MSFRCVSEVMSTTLGSCILSKDNSCPLGVFHRLCPPLLAVAFYSLGKGWKLRKKNLSDLKPLSGFRP